MRAVRLISVNEKKYTNTEDFVIPLLRKLYCFTVDSSDTLGKYKRAVTAENQKLLRAFNLNKISFYMRR